MGFRIRIFIVETRGSSLQQEPVIGSYLQVLQTYKETEMQENEDGSKGTHSSHDKLTSRCFPYLLLFQKKWRKKKKKKKKKKTTQHHMWYMYCTKYSASRWGYSL